MSGNRAAETSRVRLPGAARSYEDDLIHERAQGAERVRCLERDVSGDSIEHVPGFAFEALEALERGCGQAAKMASMIRRSLQRRARGEKQALPRHSWSRSARVIDGRFPEFAPKHRAAIAIRVGMLHNKGMASVFDVAAYIRESVAGATRMKQLKLVYYAQAWSLVWEGRPIFEDDVVEAWREGPVARALWANLEHGLSLHGDAAALSAADRQTIDEVVRCYGVFSGDQLSDLTHEDLPWQQARGSLPSSAPSRNVVTNDSMRAFYGSFAAGGHKKLTSDVVRGLQMLLSVPPDERSSLFEPSDIDADTFMAALAAP